MIKINDTVRKIVEPWTKVLASRPVSLRSFPGAGIICATISVLFWSAAGLCVKLSDDVHAIEVLTISGIIQCTIYILVVLYNKCKIFGEPEERKYLFWRCTLGTVSMACLYTSYRLIPLSDATTIRFTAPLFVSVLAFLLLGEPFGLPHILSAGITIAGVLLVGRPTFLFDTEAEVMSTQTLIGFGLALLSAIAIAISMTAMRRIQKTDSAVVIFWFSMSSVIIGLAALVVLNEFKWPSTLYSWIIIILTGLSLSADLLFITLALKLENAGPVSVVQALNVVFSFIFSFTILNEKTCITSVIGGALIFISICLTSGHKMYTDYTKTQTKTMTDRCSDRSVYVVNGFEQFDPKILSFIERKESKVSIIVKM